MSDDLFSLSLEPARDELRCRGAWPATGQPGWWRMPDGRLLAENEALLWLEQEQRREGQA